MPNLLTELRQGLVWQMLPWHIPDLRTAMYACRRNVGPAFFRGYEFRVVLAGCPRNKLLGSFFLLRASWNCERPCPQPVAVIAVAGIWCHRIVNLISVFRLSRISQCRSRNRGVNPHAAFAGEEQGHCFIVTIGGNTWRSIILHQVNEEGQSFLSILVNQIVVSSFRQTNGHRMSCQVRLQQHHLHPSLACRASKCRRFPCPCW